MTMERAGKEINDYAVVVVKCVGYKRASGTEFPTLRQVSKVYLCTWLSFDHALYALYV